MSNRPLNVKITLVEANDVSIKHQKIEDILTKFSGPKTMKEASTPFINFKSPRIY